MHGQAVVFVGIDTQLWILVSVLLKPFDTNIDRHTTKRWLLYPEVP